MKLKPLIKNFPVHIELRSLLHDILLKNTHYNYFYFVSGTVTLNSLEELMFKFHNYYNIFDSTNSRNVKYKNNQATVKFTLFYDGGDQLAFLLFARAGINGSRDHLFFDLEKVSDIRNAKTPLTIYGHELKRFNQDKYSYINESTDKKIVVAARTNVWSWFIAKDYEENFIKELKELILKRNVRLINQLIFKLKLFIGFHGVQEDFFHLKKKVNLLLAQISKIDFEGKSKVKFIDFDLPLLGRIKPAKKIYLKDIHLTIREYYKNN